MMHDLFTPATHHGTRHGIDFDKATLLVRCMQCASKQLDKLIHSGHTIDASTQDK